jgi:hypothetical protein
MGRIVLNHLKLNQSELKNFSELVVQKMDKNPTYSELQSFLKELKPLMEAYATALHDASDGGKDRTRAKNKAKDDLTDALSVLGKMIDIKSKGDESYITGTGFDVQKPNARKTIDFLEPPTGFTMVNDPRKGAINLKWNRVEGAMMYAFEELDKDNKWQNGRYNNLTAMQLTGFELGTQKTMRMKAIGPNMVTSDWTEPVSVWVS